VASTDLVINIIGNAKSAVDALDEFGNKAKESESKWTALRTGVTVASAAIVAGVGAFAKDSIDAFSEAEDSQAQLERAYEKFPAIANVSIDALRALNTEIQHKTGFDDDALAASQATLAQYGLTGDQIRQLTPLMADYAAKTGKDVNTAAEDMGKAVLGQGKALKAVGVDFKDAGAAGGNFDQLMKGLDGTVGGFAETMGDTASGKMKILETNFGDIQETVGQLLLPALTAVTDIGVKFTEWLGQNPDIVTAVAIAVGVLTAAIIGANIAMWAMAANPIVLLIMAIVVAVGLLIAGVWLLVQNWDTVVAWLSSVWQGFVSWITGVINGFVSWWNSIWTAVGQWISDVWTGFVNWITGVWNGFVAFIVAGLTLYLDFWMGIWNAVASFVSGVWTGFVNWIVGVWNGFAAFMMAALNGYLSFWVGVWNTIAGFVSGVWNGIVNAVSGAIGWVGSAIQNGLNFISSVWSGVWNGLAGIVAGAFNGVLGWIESGVNGAIDIINGMISAVNNVGGAIGVHIGLIGHVGLPRLATGTVTNGPMVALIGDNPGGREVVSPLDTYQDELRRAYTAGRTSRTVVAVGATENGPVRLDDYSLQKLGQIIVDGINRGGTKAVFDSLS
jgi:phage-related protein